MATIKLKIKTIPVSVDTEWIRLDALLKLAGAVGTGGQAKFEIQAGAVELDGAVCTMRGKKVRPGQRVRYGGKTYEIVPSPSLVHSLQAPIKLPPQEKTTAAEKVDAFPQQGLPDFPSSADAQGGQNPERAHRQDGETRKHSAPAGIAAQPVDEARGSTRPSPSQRGEKEPRPAKSPYSRGAAGRPRNHPPGGGRGR